MIIILKIDYRWIIVRQCHEILINICSRRSTCSMSIIPVDIFASEILPRLPTKTLLRFKCLDKLFYNYISSKPFINRHLQYSISSHPNRIVIVFTARKDAQQCLYLVDVDSPDSSPRYLPLPPPFDDQYRYRFQIVGSCNGLLCLNSYRESGDTYHLLIVNPCTGEVSANISISSQTPSRTCSGFGYDRLNDEYKIVAVEYYHRPPQSRTMYRKVEVYSIKARSWRFIEKLPVCTWETSFPNSHSACVLLYSNLMHWLLRYPNGLGRNIICFNLETEQWVADVEPPDFRDPGCNMYLDYFVDLGVLDGCLCLLVYSVYHTVDVWIMREYGVQESWMKFSIDTHPWCEYKPFLAYEAGAIKEILLSKRWFRKAKINGTDGYVWCNIRDNTEKEIQFSDAPRHLKARSLCVASLATGFGDPLTQKGMKVDDLVKFTIKQH